MFAHADGFNNFTAVKIEQMGAEIIQLPDNSVTG
jgi:hypothetical protein